MECSRHAETETGRRCALCGRPFCDLCLVRLEERVYCADCKMSAVRGGRTASSENAPISSDGSDSGEGPPVGAEPGAPARPADAADPVGETDEGTADRSPAAASAVGPTDDPEDDDGGGYGLLVGLGLAVLLLCVASGGLVGWFVYQRTAASPGDRACRANLQTIGRALEAYRDDHGSYPCVLDSSGGVNRHASLSLLVREGHIERPSVFNCPLDEDAAYPAPAGDDFLLRPGELSYAYRDEPDESGKLADLDPGDPLLADDAPRHSGLQERLYVHYVDGAVETFAANPVTVIELVDLAPLDLGSPSPSPRNGGGGPPDAPSGELPVEAGEPDPSPGGKPPPSDTSPTPSPDERSSDEPTR